MKASLPDEYGPNEISQINIALKSSAETLKILFSVVKKFASLFEEDDKKEILINSSHLQNSTRTLIATVKQINANPNDTSQNETLRSIVKEFIDTIYKFFKYCELASSGYVLSTSQLSAEQIAKLLQSLSSPEPFDSSQLNHLASSSLKVCTFCLALFPLLSSFPSLSSPSLTFLVFLFPLFLPSVSFVQGLHYLLTL